MKRDTEHWEVGQAVISTDLFDWIERQLCPKVCNSEELIYDDIDSQSCRKLPVIYQPFDASNRSHWGDRGSCFDYFFSTGGGKLLDFGPGDGWPSLIIASLVDEVIGVEGSVRRVEVCTENARRLDISNVEFIHVPSGEPLPLSDASFDGVMAATSVEQTPDPEVTLRELFRVLRPGGRLRIKYEALSGYRNGQEQDVWVLQVDDRKSKLILYNRDIDRECVVHYGLTFAMSRRELREVFTKDGTDLSFDMVRIPMLKRVRSSLLDAQTCRLSHPSGVTLASWLKKIGFKEVTPTHSGAEFAAKLFDHLPESRRPKVIDEVDDMLRPLVEIVIQMPAPLSVDPMITAVK